MHGGAPLSSIAGELPFLLKLLAADAPLSLQAHPGPEQAAAGFAREDAAGIPRDAPERNYKDASAKPELIVALSDRFTALAGFRPVAEVRADLGPLAADPRLAPLVGRLGSDAQLADAVAWLLDRGPEVDAVVQSISAAAGGSRLGPGGTAAWNSAAWRTAALLAEHYPADPGIAVSLLLRTVELRRGDALYLPPGNLHAYLGGVGIELMAPSDNVLRGGLTRKHVDVPELLAVVDARPLPVPVLAPAEPEPGVRVFAPGGAPFRLLTVEGEALARGVALPITAPAVAVALCGDAELAGRALPAGAAAYIADEGPTLRARGEGLLALATT